ncbi:RNase adapter RapZ [Nocardiopsis sp. NPDC007018]|uniref:RapZ C-terminal domain-containing protein n=1 Tax=Nocardiopsis sp. NPDC007018 TaxID=3155721 RepID=UPI00340A2B96
MIHLTSFGFLHAAPPEAHATFDARSHFRDPHVDPALREMTAHDQPVVERVLATSGVEDLIRAVAATAAAMAAGPSGTDVDLAVGCAGGRHRAPTIAAQAASLLREQGFEVQVHHRDLHQPVVAR